jgi:hypothetical protein
MIPNIFHCQSTDQIDWHASLQTRESRVLLAEVTSYFRVNRWLDTSLILLVLTPLLSHLLTLALGFEL